MADQPLTAREFEDILRRAGMLGGGSGAGAAAGDDPAAKAAALAKTIQETEKSLRSFKSVQQEYTKRHQAGSFAAGLFGKSTEMAQRNMAQLQKAISQHEQALDELTAQGHKATSAKYQEVQAGLKLLQTQEQMYRAQSTGAEIVRNSAAQLGQGFLRLYTLQAEYQSNLLNIVSQGGSGFQMAAAAMENAVNQMHAMQSTMASIAQSAGQSLGQLGGKFAPMAGLALTAMGHAAQAAADAARMLAQTQIRIMAQEGDKLIKTHHQLTNTGVIFGNGMTGLIDATKGTKLRLEELSAVVAENRDDFARMGIGMSQATKLIGGVAKLLASTTGQFARADRQLLALGYSYQEQAELAADTAAQMSRGGRRVSEKQVAEATIEMAKNMRIMGELAGEDMKAKRKAIQEEQRKFAINAAMTKMAQEDPVRYKQFQDQLKGMTTAQRSAAYEMQVFGVVRDKDLAIQMALNSGYRKIVQENAAALKNGTAGTVQAAETRKKYAKEETDGYVSMGQTLGKANMGLGSFEGVARNSSESLEESSKLLNASVNQAVQNVNKLVEKALQPAGTDPTTILLEAQEKAALASKRLQELVIDKLPGLSKAMTQAFNDAIAALEGRGGGVGGGLMSKILEYLPVLTAALTALTLANQLMPGKISGAFSNMWKRLPKGFPGMGGGVDNSFVDMAEGKGKFSSAMSKIPLGKIGSMLATGAKFLGPLAAIAGAGYSGFQGYQNTASNFDLKEGQQATTGQKVSSTIAGALSGLTFGLIDEKKLAQGLQSLNLKAQEMWANMSAGIAKKWEDVSSWAKKSTQEFLAAHPKLAAAIDKFPKSFDEAGKLAKNLLADTQAKFKSEFPKLYANLESTFKTVTSFTSGLMDSISKKWEDSKNWIKDKLGFASSTAPATTNVATPAAKPTTTAAGTELNSADRKNIQSWADGVNSGKYSLENVPAPYRSEVAKLVKNKPAPGTPASQPGTAPPSRVALNSVPNKPVLTAAEKANVMETVAVNTKYTNDLIMNNQKNLETLTRTMIQRLESIVTATEAAAGYGKKTARNTS